MKQDRTNTIEENIEKELSLFLNKTTKDREVKLAKNKEKKIAPDEYTLKGIIFNLSFAILNGEEHEALEILKNIKEKYPADSFGYYLTQSYAIQRAIAIQFNEKIIKELMDGGFKLQFNSFKKDILNEDKSEFLEFFFKMKKDEGEELNLDGFYDRTLYSMYPDTPKSKKRMLINYKKIIDNYMPHIKERRNNKNDPYHLKTEAGILLTYGDGTHLFDEEKEYISSFSKEGWLGIFISMRASIVSRPYDVESKIYSILNLCKNYENAREGLNDYEKLMQEQTSYEVFLDRWIDKGVDFENSKFYKTAEQILKEHYNRDLSKEERDRWLKPHDFQFKNFNNLDFDLHDFLSVYGMSFFGKHMCEFQSNEICPKDMKHDYSPGIKDRSYDGLIENLTMKISDVQLIFLESDDAKDKLFELITKDARNTFEWCKKINLQTIVKVLRGIPKFKEWKDSNNNNIIHYLMEASDVNKTSIQGLIRINHKWFHEENNNNKTPRNMMQNKHLSKSALVSIDQDLMKREIKNSIGRKKKKNLRAM